MNYIKIDLDRQLGNIHPQMFGGFAEHLGRCFSGDIYEVGSPLADEQRFRKDALKALSRLNMPIIRYPGGDFVSHTHVINAADIKCTNSFNQPNQIGIKTALSAQKGAN